ncbi:cytochrome c1 [Kappamyces sp. JEL0829]|nr:cytochrome c1 [Kappamyces sp. JEL0829]KAJ3343318.1 cytochrome c1 [Kappamyces sp. JEL0680]
MSRLLNILRARRATFSSASAPSAFGSSTKEKTVFLAKALVGSTVAGIAISELVLTDERLQSISQGLTSVALKAQEMGVPLPVSAAHAFSTADHVVAADASNAHNSLRRGYQVYREVCSACHSMDYIYWRNLVGVTHTEAEAKAMAAEYEYKDGPDDTGEYFMRAGKLSDPMPRPYANDEAARAANGGALPPDLSCISRARHGEMNYIFSLLTGYSEPPAGVSIREGLHYNRFFHGGAISMAQVLFDESVEYEDGTPNSASQIAKDVSEYLHWASYPEMDERKVLGIKTMLVTSVLLGFSIWWKRYKWSYIKSRQIVFKAPKMKEL